MNEKHVDRQASGLLLHTVKNICAKLHPNK